jgi:uncharacterized protein (TIGR04255 family)
MAKPLKFPSDIQLLNSPLIEAWLEVRWELTQNPSGMIVDPKYPYALGVFFDSIRDTFGYSEELPASQAPEGILPYVVQHRFRGTKDGWPLIQIGPGVATVNFVEPYKWSTFQQTALFLGEKLLKAYDSQLRIQAVYLRFRNGHRYAYSTKNILDFLKDNLNTTFSLPENIISQTSDPFPKQLHIAIQYGLDEPPGIGQITIGSAQIKPDNADLVLWELEVNSQYETAPDIENKEAFCKWLDDAHRVLHEWFLSLIEGTLLEEYAKEK